MQRTCQRIEPPRRQGWNFRPDTLSDPAQSFNQPTTRNSGSDGNSTPGQLTASSEISRLTFPVHRDFTRKTPFPLAAFVYRPSE
jgi:hypothetical protein